MGAPSLGTRWEGCKPGSDPRYSSGWHYRKNKFNKERRQFERMSSFETQAAGLARPRFSRPPLSIPLNPVPKPPLRFSPCPLLPVVPQDTRRNPLESAAARAQSLPASGCHLGLAAAPPPPRAMVGKGHWPSPGSGGAGSWSGGERSSPRCVCERVGECARARVCMSLSVSRLGSSALAGPPVSSFPVLSPGPHRVETGHLVKRCFWPSGRRGDRRRKAPSPEFFSIKSDKKFREK